VTIRKILWHSVAPWWGTGYGQQTAVWVPRLASLGYEVAISAFSGLTGSPQEWQGHRVYAPGNDPYGADVLAHHARHFGADLVITLLDVYALDPEPWADELAGKVASWMPIDCDDGGGLISRHISLSDELRLRQSAVQPVAMSRFGENQLRRQGHKPLYVPHGIDCSVFRPPPDKRALKAAAGLDGKFVIGINATNIGNLNRKAWPEQLAAFAKLHRRHPDTVLLAHTGKHGGKIGLNLGNMVHDMGIREAVQFSDQYMYRAGLVDQAMLAGTYGLMDLLSACSLAEGFGLPIAEAQACGVPTVVTDFSAMSEVGCGWKVQGAPYWSVIHNAYWRMPPVDAIHRAYENAYELWRRGVLGSKRKAAREHALRYDADTVLTDYWKPVLEELGER
jgi:glycosyltransferase involved in cell wall biosynthesis